MRSNRSGAISEPVSLATGLPLGDIFVLVLGARRAS